MTVAFLRLYSTYTNTHEIHHPPVVKGIFKTIWNTVHRDGPIHAFRSQRGQVLGMDLSLAKVCERRLNMPARDGTGPLGQGRGKGRGMGRCRGNGRGQAGGKMMPTPEQPQNTPNNDLQQAIKMLEEQLRSLKAQIEDKQ